MSKKKHHDWLDNYDLPELELEPETDSFTHRGFYFYCRIRFPQDTERECWQWISSTNGGYGQLFYQGTRSFAHRFSWELYHQRSIPPGLVIRHSCHNPLCVNPHHLTPGTQTQNMQDMKSAGREGYVTKITPQQQLEIIASPLRLGELARKYGVSKTTIHRIQHKYK